jgi:hypothetical protein
MTINVIEYVQFIGSNYSTPLSVDGVSYDLESEYSKSIKNTIYSQCPVWKHRSNRVYTVRSPIDVHLSVDVNSQSLYSENLSQEQFDKYFFEAFDTPEPGWCTEEKTTIQMTIPRILFWTKKKNIWIEQRAHPLTSLNNNFVVVGGCFNMSNWTRPISFAFDVIDTNRPIIIRRGDPIYQISFYSPNLDDGYLLKKSFPSSEIMDKSANRSTLTTLFNNKIPQTIKNKLFKNEESKCPFKFLWK